MTELIRNVLNYMIGIIMVILIGGIPVVIGITALVILWMTLWRWLGLL